MKLIKLILVVVLFSRCNADTPHTLLGKWRVEEYANSITQFDERQKSVLEDRAKSTTYEFKPDFNVRVTSGFHKNSKTGTWYWDPQREKLVINSNTILEEGSDTIFIEEISNSEMIWLQIFERTDSSYIFLKKVD